MREMKNSGVAWIGEIPAEWDVLRNKNLVYEINERCDADTRLPLLSVSEYYGVAPKAEKTDENTILSRAETLEGYKICEPDDVAMNIMLAWKRAQAVSKYHGIISPAYCVYRKKEDAPLNMDFFHYLIRSDLYINIYKRYSTGIIESRLRLYPEKFLSLHSHVPPIVEQQEIAKVLDVKSSQIDILIANQEAQIEKLKQYKQSLITKVVTKGLNPDVEMKDSGVEWIGEIPKDWDTVSLGGVTCGMRNGYVGPTRDLFFESGVKYIQSLHTKDGSIDFEKHPYYVSEEWANQHPKIYTNDILIVQTGDIGQVAYVSEEYNGCNCHALIIATPNTSIINPEYLTYYLLSYTGKELMLSFKTGALLPHLNSGKIKNTPVSVPSLSTQKEIVSYLDDQCAKIDKLIEIKRSKIAKLNEYKKSLIYEYVTGKKEVV